MIAGGFDADRARPAASWRSSSAPVKVAADLGAHPGTGEIVTFFSPKGGVGTTTLAVNTAVLLAGGRGREVARAGRPANGVLPSSRVLLIDLDLQFGQVATHLNLMPRYDIAGLASDEPSLADPELARTYLTTHGSGLNVLAAPARPEADFRVTLEHLQRIVELMQPSFDHILVDLGSRLDPRSALAPRAGRRARVRPLPGDRGAARDEPADGVPGRDDARCERGRHLVINHVFPKELLKTRDVENLLRAKPAAEIPYTEVEMIRSVNEGVPLVIEPPDLAGGDRDAPAWRRPSSGSSSTQAATKRGATTDLRPPLARRLVPEEGFEPPRLAAAGFKPAASAIPPLRRGRRPPSRRSRRSAPLEPRRATGRRRPADCGILPRMKLYLAGPLFTTPERTWNEAMAARLETARPRGLRPPPPPGRGPARRRRSSARTRRGSTGPTASSRSWTAPTPTPAPAGSAATRMAWASPSSCSGATCRASGDSVGHALQRDADRRSRRPHRAAPRDAREAGDAVAAALARLSAADRRTTPGSQPRFEAGMAGLRGGSCI